MNLRLAVRGLRRSPGFTAAAVLSLALGVGLNGGVFAVLEAMLLRPLPYAEAARLFGIQDIRASGRSEFLSFDEYLQIRHVIRTFSGLAAYEAGFAASEALRLNAPSGRTVQGFAVSDNLFEVLGVRPLLGRAFASEETGTVVVLGYSVWQREFGSDPGILGKQIRIDGQSYIVIGVMPKGFWFPILDSGFWTALTPTVRPGSEEYTLSLIGRLQEGRSRAAARSELTVLMERLNVARAEPDLFRRVRIVSLEEERNPSDAALFFLMQAVVGCVLLIACANVSSLLLVRGAARVGATAIRSALGGTYRDLVSPFLMETLTIVGLATVMGMSLAFAGTRLLAVAVAPVSLQGVLEPELNVRVGMFAATVFCLLAAACCLAPMVQVRRVTPMGLLTGSGPNVIGSGKVLKRARGALVSLQLGLSITLLVSTAVLTQRLMTLSTWDPGVVTAGVFTIGLGGSKDAAATNWNLPLIMDRLRGGVPGLTHVGIRARSDFTRLRPSGADAQTAMPCACEIVTPGYLRALGIPLLEGRYFAESDVIRGGAVIVDQRAATGLNVSSGLVGTLVWLEAHDSVWSGPVIGIVGNINLRRPVADAVRAPPNVYIAGHPDAANGASIVLRAAPDARIMNSARAVLLDIDAEFPVLQLNTLEASLYAYLTPMRGYVAMCAALAVLALVLAMIGLYGTMSYTAQERRRELGIRAALGAGRGRITAVILRDALGIVALGGSLGILGAIAVTILLQAIVTGIPDMGPYELIRIIVLLALIVVVAGLLPALRASRVDPSSALRVL